MVNELSSKKDLLATIEHFENQLVEAAQLNVGMSNLLAAVLIENGGSIEVKKSTILNIDRNLYIEQTAYSDKDLFKFELRDGS